MIQALDIVQIIVAQVIGTFFAAIGVYAAIRADLAQVNARLKLAEEGITRLVTRFDDLIDRRANGNAK